MKFSKLRFVVSAASVTARVCPAPCASISVCLNARSPFTASHAANGSFAERRAVRHRHRRCGYPQPTDLVFPGNHIKLFNNLLERTKLKFDRDGKPRTAYSLRHTYICMRLMEGADIYQIAKNCRTSVEMIEKHYAIHLKNTLDASAINVRKAKPKRRPKADADEDEPNLFRDACRLGKRAPWGCAPGGLAPYFGLGPLNPNGSSIECFSGIR